MKKITSNKLFAGSQNKYEHQSDVLNCTMQFSIYLPPQVTQLKPGETLPALYWLSGLTCTDDNFSTKAGAQKMAAKLGLILIIPDTSPRGDQVSDDDNYYLGQGAGFYLNATQPPWSDHYHMYDYVVDELPKIINANFAIDEKKVSIFGHSMGGHGALTIALKNPDKYKSVSAFSPISHPSDCSWGQKILTEYLGSDNKNWQQYDAAILMANSQQHIPALVDQGLDDDFLIEQLKTHTLKAAAKKSNYPLTLRMHDGYDHSYYFISSFIDEHLQFHFDILTK
ncbi:MAG: S-formylglutathione hydrolase [Saccharospirillaceae bacterium]|nr:S-formylglutathione hydrolase [Pseudomonadales bacterium]NRB77499.1 S-formylglutathione hydrolase [Saccharospirillaceae bacterium]